VKAVSSPGAWRRSTAVLRLLAAACALGLALPAWSQAQFGPPTGQVSAPSDGLLIHTPREPATSTGLAVVHVLGRTVAGASVKVGGEAVAVQPTGVFARDNVPLEPGLNTVLVEATLPGGRRIAQALAIERIAPAAPSLPAAPTTDALVVEPLTPALFIAGPDGVALSHGLHEVRLGGPFLAELPAGTLLLVNGRTAQHYRVALAPDTTVWAPIAALAPAAEGTARPWAAFTSLSVEGSARGDVVSIPLPADLPFAVRAVPAGTGPAQLELDLYGAHLATTWITQRASARLVREVSVEQPADGRLRVRITLNGRTLWGWRVERSGGQLQLAIPAPPAIQPRAPLKGLRIALEAGHGGPGNLGAIGGTGVPEKDVNRWTVDALAAELEAAGARVLQVRDGDESPTLAERAARVAASDAQLFISVHANAVDTARGVLRVQGTSTYYRHAHQRELASAIQRRMLAVTGLADFGVVGAFNYLPLRRTTGVPAVLVEQAFMTHPADEAQMLDPRFRARIAHAVRLGLEDYLRGIDSVPAPH
jgi:N-acetylmuramoyl-L-alanine amidase